MFSLVTFCVWMCYDGWVKTICKTGREKVYVCSRTTRVRVLFILVRLACYHLLSSCVFLSHVSTSGKRKYMYSPWTLCWRVWCFFLLLGLVSRTSFSTINLFSLRSYRTIIYLGWGKRVFFYSGNQCATLVPPRACHARKLACKTLANWDCVLPLPRSERVSDGKWKVLVNIYVKGRWG